MINLMAAALIAAFSAMMIRITGNLPQWLAVGVGFYAVFSWAGTLRARDPATFRLIWGTPAFVCVTIGYGLIALTSYALAFWSAPFAEIVLGIPKRELAFYLGASGALSGFLGVIMGGALADRLRARNPAGRLIVVMIGVLGPLIPIWIGFSTSVPAIATVANAIITTFGGNALSDAAATFYVMNFAAGVLGSSALGAAAATTQDLVLPRMRGTATAAFFLGTTLIGLAFGPYLVGQISDFTATIVNGERVGNLQFGMLSVVFAVAPIALALLLYAYRSVPAAEATIAQRADAAAA
jgi:MFS family permease